MLIPETTEITRGTRKASVPTGKRSRGSPELCHRQGFARFAANVWGISAGGKQKSTSFENSELAYWFSGNGLCLLYDNQAAGPEISSGVIIFWKMTSDFSFLRELDDRIEVTVNLAD